MSSKRIIASALLVSGLFIGSTATSFADTSTTPTPNVASSSSEHQTQEAAYKLALTQFYVTRITNDINYRMAMVKYWTDWKATMQSFNASWQSTLTAFQTANAAYHAKFDPLQAAHRSVLNAADVAFLAATAGSPSNDALIAAIKTYWSTNKAENTAFKSAVTAVGVAPVRPVRPAEPVKPIAPVKPIDPIKPVAPKK
jgi:hypothetical protein